MNDLISRQAAIDAVRELYIQSPKINNDIVYDMAIDQAHDALVNLTSVKPKKGEWIKRAPSLYRCSECGRFSPGQENFCPNCGAEMEESDDKN